MRTLGTDLSTAADAAVTTPRYLIELDHPTDGTLRYATGKDANGNDIVYGGNTYTAKDIRFTQFSGIGTAQASVTARFGTNDLTFLSIFLGLTQSVDFRVYVTTALDGTASPSLYDLADNVVKIYDGEITGGYRVVPGYIEVETVIEEDFFPPWHVNSANGFNSIVRAGVYPFPGGTITIERA